MVPILFFLWRVTVKDSSVNNSVRPVSAVGGASTQWTPTGDACHAELHKYTLTYLNSLGWDRCRGQRTRTKNDKERMRHVFSVGAVGSVHAHPRKTRRDLAFLWVERLIKLDKHTKRSLAAFRLSVFLQRTHTCTCSTHIHARWFYWSKSAKKSFLSTLQLKS